MGSYNIVKVESYLRNFDVVIVTGASSGIGECFLNEIYALSNAEIYAVSRTAPALESSRVHFIAADLSALSKLDCAADTILKSLEGGAEKSKILLINNAGFGAYGEFPEPSLERNLKMIDLNVRALVAMCGKFAGHMKAGSAVVNIASTAAWQPCPQLSVYAATKAFVLSFTLSISAELEGAGIRVLAVCPGPTSSNFFKAAGFDSPPLPNSFGHKPDDVVHASLSALSAGKKLVVVGLLNKLQTTLVKILPTIPVLKISSFILKKVRSVKR